MSEVPTQVSESAAIEIVRKEGSAQSFKAIGTITAGEVLKWGASGAIQMVGTELDNGVFLGVALQNATSGQRVTVAKGWLRIPWDSVGTVTNGTLLVASTTRSGWFTAGTTLSGGMSIGIYSPQGGNTVAALAAANSGLLQAVRTI